MRMSGQRMAADPTAHPSSSSSGLQAANITSLMQREGWFQGEEPSFGGAVWGFRSSGGGGATGHAADLLLVGADEGWLHQLN